MKGTSFALCEAETTQGLEFISADELAEYGAQVDYQQRGEVVFRYTGDLSRLLALRTVQSIDLLQRFDIPRPRALLGNAELRLLLDQIDTARRLSPRNTYQSLYVAAAGSDSSVMQRLKAVLSEHTGLAIGSDKGDLWLRIRPGKDGGWETLVRLSPRPLVTRAWRVCNLEGALNAATAQAMIRLSAPTSGDVFVNLGCGSGTLLIERQSSRPCRQALGVDLDATALRCAQANVKASGLQARIELQLADMTQLPLASAFATALCADLPFGQLSGSHRVNERLYAPMLAEAARIAQVGARFVAITHEVRLMEKLLAQQVFWETERTIPVNLRGLHPRIYVLRRVKPAAPATGTDTVPA